jgi:hypothetical protein
LPGEITGKNRVLSELVLLPFSDDAIDFRIQMAFELCLFLDRLESVSLSAKQLAREDSAFIRVRDPSREIKSLVRFEISLRRASGVVEVSKKALGCWVNEVPNRSQLTIVSSSPRRSRLRISRSCAITQSRQALRRVDTSEDFKCGGRVSVKKANTCCTSV